MILFRVSFLIKKGYQLPKLRQIYYNLQYITSIQDTIILRILSTENKTRHKRI